jgi:hypothetical protein
LPSPPIVTRKVVADLGISMTANAAARAAMRRRGFGLLDQPDSINALYGHRLRGCHERLKNLK